MDAEILKTLRISRKPLIDRDIDGDRIVIESAVASLGVTPPRPRYRVIQWGTGAVGAEMITAILDHRTDLDLVGAKVYSEAKHGKDVGTLVGRDPVGVLATLDTAEVTAMPAANVATAMQVLNAVPAVCDAAPGFATMASLPLVRSHTGFGHAWTSSPRRRFCCERLPGGTSRMAAASSDIWEVMSTARTIRRPPSCCSVGRSSRRCRTSCSPPARRVLARA